MELLNDYYWLLQNIKSYKKMLSQLEADAKKYKQQGLLKKIEELQNLYETKIQESLEKQRKIEEAIERLQGVEKQIILLRYKENKTWEEISCEVHYSYSQLHRIHRKALEKLKEAYKRS
ncbi:sigma factor-like helix-turn-helix DNA-binding protein [Thermoanaerobacter pentosaceus]|uniref:RNA polymerase sigma factor (Sigma-70 family) n=1 Tax=Thermoanaerobacter pentosaceus TaxID=694059 RepID=A0ABT9M6X0_9THEO|nr:sigma factor-like helix-turn-helix DNA-binding protein [Thermoanaerobacter pentosaceus]MDP9751822.1 RNA polymerase sigma factor (sigma-70 family) [Thermoanaerobacter pentosaceus]